MESSEPTLVPEWLKSNGCATGSGRIGHRSASSTSHAVSLAKYSRNKSSRNAVAQKLEKMAIKQSRQLIPMTPVMPKPLVLSSADKLKPKIALRNGDLCNTSKIGLQSQASGSALFASNSPHGAQTMPESSKTSQVGKFCVLKPPWEISTSPVHKDGSALANDVGIKHLDPLSNPAVSTASSSNSSSSRAAISERKAAPPNLDAPSVFDKKRMLSHARIRNEFFNSVRKKTSTNTSMCCELSPATSVPHEQSGEMVKETTTNTSSANGVDSSRNSGVDQKSFSKENNAVSTSEVIPGVEEETAFLSSLGWEENGSEDDGLTEEEINVFYQEVMKSRPTLKLRKVSLLHKLMLVEVHPD